MKFIYVMDEQSVKLLEKKGYRLLKADYVNHIWIFENQEATLFGLDFECQYVLSNVLTF